MITRRTFLATAATAVAAPACKPKACQMVAGGRSEAETSGERDSGTGIPEGCQRRSQIEKVWHPFRVRSFRPYGPEVSLRSTSGYRLATLRVADQTTFTRDRSSPTLQPFNL